MVGLLARLFTYRERSDLSPLENFLIEAFADVFNRLNADDKRSLLEELLPAHALLDLPDLQGAAIRTQMTLDETGLGKRPDMLLALGERPLVVIEAKIGALFQEHSVPLGNADATNELSTQNQLETYAKWMASAVEKPEGWRGAVILLSAFTNPPSGFDEARIDEVFTSSRTWADVGFWIKNHAEFKETWKTHRALAAEFYSFLEEKNLMTKYLTSRDLAAAMLFAPSFGALKATFSETMEAVAKHVPRLSAGRRLHHEFWAEGNLYWSWFHFARAVKRDRSKPYVAVGICFEIGEQWTTAKSKLPADEPFFFVLCGDDWFTEVPTTFLTGTPSAWIEIEGEFAIVCAKPVREFAADPNARVAELKEWAKNEVNRLTEYVPSYAAAPVGQLASEENEE